jgi:hypothetical protein
MFLVVRLLYVYEEHEKSMGDIYDSHNAREEQTVMTMMI